MALSGGGGLDLLDERNLQCNKLQREFFKGNNYRFTKNCKKCIRKSWVLPTLSGLPIPLIATSCISIVQYQNQEIDTVTIFRAYSHFTSFTYALCMCVFPMQCSSTTTTRYSTILSLHSSHNLPFTVTSILCLTHLIPANH